MDHGDITHSVHCNVVPPEAEAAMEDLYQHRYASSVQLKLYGQLDGGAKPFHTYLARREGKAIAALVFQIEQRRACVLNEQMQLNGEDIGRFADCVFAHFPSVAVISFPVVQADIRSLPFPYQRAPNTQDIVLTLPSTQQAYMAALGKSTRTYVRRYVNKLKRDFPTFSFQVYAKDAIRDNDVREIIALNRVRMSGRQQSSYIDTTEEERMLALLKLRGFVGVMRVNGELCAGTINTRFGDNYFLQVLAHNPAFNGYGMGTICCFLTICECIARQGHAYHFLWGQYEYKYRLLGIQRDLDHVAIYRSRLQMLRHARMALGIALHGHRYTIRSWILNKARRKDESHMGVRLIFHAFNGLRDIKRRVSSILMRRDKTVPSAGAQQGHQ